MGRAFKAVEDDRLLVRRSIDSDETPLDAFFAAADAADVDLSMAEPRLAEAIDGDALTALLDSGADAAAPNTTIYFELWDRGFLLTSSTVEVYSTTSTTPDSIN